jgi:hypothetical protein
MKVSVYFITDTVWELTDMPSHTITRACVKAQNLRTLTVKLLEMKWY